VTDNFRNTGYFNNTSTSILVPFDNPTINTPVTFRQSATDANNHLTTSLASVYAQDQIEWSRHVQTVLGLRAESFDLRYHNNRNGDDLRRKDTLLSPRAGLIFKPVSQVSLYGSTSVSYLPSSGDQFASLTNITQQMKPEKFTNLELGAKWDVRRDLSFTTALYQLDRTQTRSSDPNDPTRILQTGSQRTQGVEIGANGNLTKDWSFTAGYSYQDASITSTTSAASAGAQVGQVPHHLASLWNKYQITPRFGAGLGLIHRSDMFATIDNTVRLPGYTRVDAALFYAFNRNWRVQANVENLLDKRYVSNADSNTNLSPGAPRGLRVLLRAKF